MIPDRNLPGSSRGLEPSTARAASVGCYRLEKAISFKPPHYLLRRTSPFDSAPRPGSGYSCGAGAWPQLQAQLSPEKGRQAFCSHVEAGAACELLPALATLGPVPSGTREPASPRGACCARKNASGSSHVYLGQKGGVV